jgi:hypothetical protein
MIAHVSIVRAIDVNGSQKSRLRIAVDGCIQKIARILPPRRSHQRHRKGTNQDTSSENKLNTIICVRFIYAKNINWVKSNAELKALINPLGSVIGCHNDD